VIVTYIDSALRRATYQQVEDGLFVAEVPGLDGVLATAPTLEGCRDQLAEVVEEWVLVRVARSLPVPAIDGVTVSVKSAS